MATATKKVNARRQVARVARDKATSLEFLVHRDNGGDFHWEIVGVGGESLAQSGRFASREDAERAARCVYDGAGSARFEPRADEQRRLVGA